MLNPMSRSLRGHPRDCKLTPALGIARLALGDATGSVPYEAIDYQGQSR